MTANDLTFCVTALAVGWAITSGVMLAWVMHLSDRLEQLEHKNNQRGDSK